MWRNFRLEDDVAYREYLFREKRRDINMLFKQQTTDKLIIIKTVASLNHCNHH